MDYTVDRFHLRIVLDTDQYTPPTDELTRMQRSLEPLAEALADVPGLELRTDRPRAALGGVMPLLEPPRNIVSRTSPLRHPGDASRGTPGHSVARKRARDTRAQSALYARFP